MTDYGKSFNNHNYQTPEWVESLSTRKVLTMTFIEGRHLSSFMDENPSQEEKNHFGQILWDFFHDQINNNYTVYADAHPGNFIFTNDRKLGIIDFGCIKTSPRDFFNNYIRLFDVHMNEDVGAMMKVYQDLEMIDPNPKNPEFERNFYTFCQAFGNHFLSPYRTEFFDFGDRDFDKGVADFAKEATKFTEPRGSRHFIYVSRLHIGLYRILMKLGATVKTTESKVLLQDYLYAQNKSI